MPLGLQGNLIQQDKDLCMYGADDAVKQDEYQYLDTLALTFAASMIPLFNCFLSLYLRYYVIIFLWSSYVGRGYYL